jgi:hypothetical protein
MNPLPTPDLSLEQKIWRYVDLTKLVLMLTRRALYFAPLSDLDDPYEGYMPRCDAEAFAKIQREQFFNRLPIFKEQAKAQGHDLDYVFDLIEADARQKLSFREIRRGFGVSCWHANDHESEAMRRFYSALGCGIAIESTVRQLRDVLDPTPGITIGRIEYKDFDKAKIVKGADPHILMCKRPSFAYEQEVRAMLPLPQPGEGKEVACDLSRLVTCIHMSPKATPGFSEVIAEICSGNIFGQTYRLQRSPLFDNPDYDMTPDLRPSLIR